MLTGLILALSPQLGKAQADDKDEALIEAAQIWHLEQAISLLNSGAGVNAADSFGGTAPMYAARVGHLEVVKLLLDNRMQGCGEGQQETIRPRFERSIMIDFQGRAWRR
jgi:hypothetical protein